MRQAAMYLGVFLIGFSSFIVGAVSWSNPPYTDLALESFFHGFFSPATPLPKATHATLTLKGTPLLWESGHQQPLKPMRWRMGLALGEGLNPYLSLETDALTDQPMPWKALLQATGSRQIHLVGCAQAPEAMEQIKVLFYLEPPHPRHPPGWLLLWQACEDSGCGYGLRLYANAPTPADRRLFLADTDPLLPTEGCTSLFSPTP